MRASGRARGRGSRHVLRTRLEDDDGDGNAGIVGDADVPCVRAELLHREERVSGQLEERPAARSTTNFDFVPADATRAVERFGERLLHGEATREGRRDVTPL